MARRGQSAVLKLFPTEEEQLKEFRDGGPVKKEKAMAADEITAELAETNRKLDNLLDVLSDGAISGKRRRRHRDDDEPESVREMEERGRRGEVRQVAFQVSVPVGRRGESMPGFLIFDVSVRDDRDLEDLADEVERKFRTAKVFPPKDRFEGRGGFGGGGFNRGGGYGGYYRRDDRDWRDRRY
jgi:hypothetical protein